MLEAMKAAKGEELHEAFQKYFRKHTREVKWQWLCEFEITGKTPPEMKLARRCEVEDLTMILVKSRFELDRAIAMMALHEEEGYCDYMDEVCETILDEMNSLFEGKEITNIKLGLTSPFNMDLQNLTDIEEGVISSHTYQIVQLKYRIRK